MIVRVAGWSAGHPWRALALWLVFVAACVAAGGVSGTRQAVAADFQVGEAGRASAIAAAGGVAMPRVERVLIRPAGEGELGAARAAAEDVAGRMRGLPEVAVVDAPAVSADRTALLVSVTLRGDERAARAALPTVLAQTEAARASHPGARIEQAGDASVSHGVETQVGRDVLRAEAITLPITVIVLVLFFGSVLAAAVPVLLALSSVAAAVGLYALASYLLPDAGGVVTSVILMMGLAVGIDYSLFYLGRVREERAAAGGALDHRAAVRAAAATSGRAIAVSGGAVVVSVAGLYLADDVIFSSIATGTIIVVAAAVVSSLTALPALLATLGPRIDSSRLAFLARRGLRREGRGRSRLLAAALGRPVLTLVLSTAALAGLAAPVLAAELRAEGIETFPRAIPAVASYREVIARFPGQAGHHLVAVRTTDPGGPAAALTDLARRASADPAVGVAGPATTAVSARGDMAVLRLPIRHLANSEAGEQSLRRLRTDLAPAALGGLNGVDYAVGGTVAANLDYVEHELRRLAWVFGFGLLLTTVVMAAAFRSVLVGVVSSVLNVLSASAAVGALVLAVQLGGLGTAGVVTARIPLFVFAVLIGLSMDYHVFVVSRIREAALHGLPAADAVRAGVRASARVVTGAAVIMVSVFAAFLFGHVLEMLELGFSLAFGVLLDAVVVRVLLLPSVLTLLGRTRWWPSSWTPRAQARAQTREWPGPL